MPASSRNFRTDIGDITVNNYNQLRVIRNNVIAGKEAEELDESFFKTRVVAEYGDLCQLGKDKYRFYCLLLLFFDVFVCLKLAYFNDISVGGLIAKRESPALVKIVFLGILLHYRKQGLGSKLLEYLEGIVRKGLSSNTTTTSTNASIEIQYQVTCDDIASRSLFVDKFGFIVKETLTENKGDIILSKTITATKSE